MFCIGLTGNIGSGKTTVSHFFTELGIERISADRISKALTAAGQPAYQAIANHFGPSVVLPNGELNRQALRERIFQGVKDRLWLEQLLHPLIRQGIEQAISQVHSKFCIIEIPLLHDRSNFYYLNRVLLIETTAEEKIHRTIQRDSCSAAEAASILSAQADPMDLFKLADDILYNSGPLETLKIQVAALHTHYLRLSD